MVDLPKIRNAIADQPIALVLDATQSIGAKPLDTQIIQPDFLVAASYKWLLGAYGGAYLYANPKHHDARPIENNWSNREDSDKFSALTDYRDHFQKGARRFDGGQKANFITQPMAIEALKQINGWKVPHIEVTLRALTKTLEAELQEIGLKVQSEPNRVAHFMGAKLPEGLDPQKVAEQLKANKIYISVRGSSLRISPYLYNDQADCQKLVSTIKEAIHK